VREALDAAGVRRWCRLSAEALGRTRGEIDRLNVFPVPDRDTGTNLHLTMLAAAEALDAVALDGGADEAGTEAMWRALAHGALLGARGNSGVILSQVLRGLARVLGGAGAAPGGPELREALEHAAELARSAVAHPVEGTIVSVLAAAASAAGSAEDSTAGSVSAPGPVSEVPPGSASTTSGTVEPRSPRRPRPATLAAVARAAAAGARSELLRTTGRLDVLARAGVVDAGAAGLCVVLDALVAVVTEEFPDSYEVPPPAAAGGADGAEPAGGTGPYGRREDDGDLREGGGPGEREGHGREAGYEVMYLLDAPDDAVPSLREALDELGDSLVVVGGDGLWNVHVHTGDAGAAIEAGIAAGRPHRIRVTCLQGHSRPGAGRRTSSGGRGVVAVTAADGLAGLFESCGAKVVRREAGGVPPMAVLIEAIVAAGDEVAVLPNEPDVLAVAEAAAELAGDSGVRVAVLPTTAAVQGLAALAVHDPGRRFDDDVIAMTRALGATRSGHLETAAEEAVTSAGICRPGDVLGLIEGDVCLIGTDLTEVAQEILGRMLSGGGELATLITGTAAPGGLAEAVESRLRAERPDVELVVYEGGQERHPVLIGVE
jgi:dihydroxyacetone kinase-like predicted kinase